jgi:integrase
MFCRLRYQFGSLQLKTREKEDPIWELRYYEPGPPRRRITVGILAEYPNESAVRKTGKMQALLMKINVDERTPNGNLTLGALIARYEEEEMPERYSTRAAYRPNLDVHIKPRWADTPLASIKAVAVEQWLGGLPLAPKTKAHIRGLMHVLFQSAARWELLDRNPISHVRVKGGTKRLQRPRILEPGEFSALVSYSPDPYRTMFLIAGCLDLRCSEIVGLQCRTSTLSAVRCSYSEESFTVELAPRRPKPVRTVSRSTVCWPRRPASKASLVGVPSGIPTEVRWIKWGHQ